MIDSIIIENKIEVTLSATAENLDIADDLVTAFLNDKHFTSELFSCRMLLREGLMNAVVHGCNTNPKLTVTMTAEVTSEKVYVLKINDPGSGFDWQKNGANVPDTGQAHGRGLAIMHKYSDSITYNDIGNVIVLTKKLVTETCTN